MAEKKLKPKIVVIGGGTGSSVVLSGLRKMSCELTAVVNMADNGGSSGVLREELGVLPPGDVRQCLVALSRTDPKFRALFSHRFDSGVLKGHTVGNLFLAAAELARGDFGAGVKLVGELLNTHGKVLPVTLSSTHLCAELRDGPTLVGESAVTKSKELRKKGVKKLFLRPKAQANPGALQAISKADMVVIAPGNFYSSIMPGLLVGGVSRAISRSRAKKIYISNLLTQHGHTEGFGVPDFISELERLLGVRLIDTVIYNTAAPASFLRRLRQEKKEFVRFGKVAPSEFAGVRFIGKPLISSKIVVPSKSDAIASQRSILRHDSGKLAKVLMSIL